MINIWCNFLAKSVKPFKIYRKMKYLTFDFDLCGHKNLFFHLALHVYYIVQFLTKSVKPFRIYCIKKYLTFAFDL